MPMFHEWINRKTGQLNYFTTQMITGHGSFRDYLYRCKKINSNVCLQCNSSPDTAQHTLEECSGWRSERQFLQDEIGMDLSLEMVIRRMLETTTAWTAFDNFCKIVLKKKEEDVRRLIRMGEIEK